MKKNFRWLILVCAVLCLHLGACAYDGSVTPSDIPQSPAVESVPADIPEYDGSPYAIINENIPYFGEEEKGTEVFEEYGELDSLGRCTAAYANLCKELMPTEERGEIGMIRPSGWHTVKYDGVDGNYLFNRCHLIGFQLAGENANERNLITGTRYLNVQGMLPFENQVADYIRETDNHVLYRVTPIYEGDDLLARGVEMEAWSVEDDGDGICFHVFVYNVQPGIRIDYATGESEAIVEDEPQSESLSEERDSGETYVLNTNTMKFHFPSCSSVDDIKERNKQIYEGSREELLERGYQACKRCNP